MRKDFIRPSHMDRVDRFLDRAAVLMRDLDRQLVIQRRLETVESRLSIVCLLNAKRMLMDEQREFLTNFFRRF